MNRKIIILFVLSMLILGCISLEDLFGGNQYEIFSNLPSENAKAVGYFKLTGDGVSEIHELAGSLFTGGTIKKIKEGEVAFVVSNDSFGIVAYVKTNMSIEEAITQLNSTLSSYLYSFGGYYAKTTDTGFNSEAKEIAGKNVTVLYLKSDKEKKMPICLWKEGDTLKGLVNYGYASYDGVRSANIAGADSPLVGYALKSLSLALPSNQNNTEKFGDTCDVVLENKYATDKVKELLGESEQIKSSIPVSGKFFGEVKISANLESLSASSSNGSAYMTAFGDDNADNFVIVSKGSGNEYNMCYSYSSSDKSEVISKDGKQACLKEGGGSFLTMNLKYFTLERKVGEYSLMLISYIKDNRDVVKGEAENIVFSINLLGEEQNWTDKMSFNVRVYERPAGSLKEQPVAEAKVEVYNSSYGYGGYNEAVKTAYTDDKGVAKFENLEIGSYDVVVSKIGYRQQTTYVYAGRTNVSVMLNQIGSLKVTVKESADYEYGNPIPEAKVELYNKTITGTTGRPIEDSYPSYYGYELVKTLYTNSNGVADFGKIEIKEGKVKASKDGYRSGENYVYSSSYYDTGITVYLTKIEPLIVKVYDARNRTTSISGAIVKLYNRTPSYTYEMVKTLETNSNGVANFSMIDVEYGKIEVSKVGYFSSTQTLDYTSSGNVTAYLQVNSTGQSYNGTFYPATRVYGNGCVNPSKYEAPPEWALGIPDGAGACFWESSVLSATFDRLLNVSEFHLTVQANGGSVNKPLQILVSSSDDCFNGYGGGEGYKTYAVFTPDVVNEYKTYIVANGTANVRCVAIADLTRDGYGSYIDAIGVK